VGDIADIPNVDASKAADALNFHNEIRQSVDIHLEDKQYKTEGYLTYPIVGTDQPTLQSARLDAGKVRLSAELEGSDGSGDGTVPRVSATPLELSRARREMFAAKQHSSLQNADEVLVQLEEILRGNDIDLELFQAASDETKGIEVGVRAKLGLQIDDAYSVDEPIQIRVWSNPEVKFLRAHIVNTEGSNHPIVMHLTRKDDKMESEEFRLDPGAYRVTVFGDEWVTPVTDVFVVQRAVF